MSASKQSNPSEDGFEFTAEQERLLSMPPDQMATEMVELHLGTTPQIFYALTAGGASALLIVAALILLFKQRVEGHKIGGVTSRTTLLIVFFIVLATAGLGTLI